MVALTALPRGLHAYQPQRSRCRVPPVDSTVRFKHLPALHSSPGCLVVAREAAVIVKADTLLDQVRNLLSHAERLTQRAEEAGSLDTALRGISQVRGVLELLGEVSRQLAGKWTRLLRR